MSYVGVVAISALQGINGAQLDLRSLSIGALLNTSSGSCDLAAEQDLAGILQEAGLTPVKLWCGGQRDATRVMIELFAGDDADRLLALECLAETTEVDEIVLELRGPPERRDERVRIVVVVRVDVHRDVRCEWRIWRYGPTVVQDRRQLPAARQ